MEKAIESDININDVVKAVVDEVAVINDVQVVNGVPVVDDVQVVDDVHVQVSDSIVVDGVVDPNAVVVNIDHV